MDAINRTSSTSRARRDLEARRSRNRRRSGPRDGRLRWLIGDVDSRSEQCHGAEVPERSERRPCRCVGEGVRRSSCPPTRSG
jgi:hypothetical protein